MDSEPSVVWSGRATCPICGLVADRSHIRARESECVISRNCPIHGPIETTIDRSGEYFGRALTLMTPMLSGKNCSTDCITCGRHPKRFGAVILELLDECDTLCHTCVAGSKPGAGKIKSWATIKSSIDAISRNHSGTTLMLSGGEPTISPCFKKTLSYACELGCFANIILITNGIKLSEDVEMLKFVASFKDKVEIHLQFDSLDQRSLNSIRGNVSVSERLNRLNRITDVGLFVTLICVVVNGLNQDKLSVILDLAKSNGKVVGVTFQPIRAMGRLSKEFEGNSARITLGDVIYALRDDVDVKFNPHPLSPHSVAFAYLARQGNEGPEFDVEKAVIGEELYPPLQSFGKTGIRVLVNAYLDRDIYNELFAQNCSVGFASHAGKVIPLDTYYLFYKGI